MQVILALYCLLWTWRVCCEFKSIQCGLGCLHSGVSRVWNFIWKDSARGQCILSGSSNMRGFGIILDLEQCLSAFIYFYFYFYLLNWLMASFCPHCHKFPTAPLTVHSYSEFFLLHRTELFFCIRLLCQLCRLIQSGHVLDCFGIFVQLRKITFPLRRGGALGLYPPGWAFLTSWAQFRSYPWHPLCCSLGNLRKEQLSFHPRSLICDEAR